ncbi:MAG TPA: hypothetical protein VKR58_06090 [Aquella sp.]|nr:hypothetical protein [Aquella sp.]
MKKKGDFVKVSGFEGIVINEIFDYDFFNKDGSIRKKAIKNYTGVRCSFTMPDKTKYWIVVPYELILERKPRE